MKKGLKTCMTIDEYIAGFPEDVQVILKQMRAVIRTAAPDAEEKINYGIPTFFTTENLVHFAGYKHHVGFYPSPSGIEHFKRELANYELSRGTVRFPLDKPIPYDLVARITEFRVKESRERAQAKSK
ncbi:MAG: hypothetical protein HPY72_07245 [Anaerolineae bacterium]|nr:hypothetical protein [Anaerolineae bacterium]